MNLNLTGMFDGATAFTQDLSSWQSASGVTITCSRMTFANDGNHDFIANANAFYPPSCR